LKRCIPRDKDGLPIRKSATQQVGNPRHSARLGCESHSSCCFTAWETPPPQNRELHQGIEERRGIFRQLGPIVWFVFEGVFGRCSAGMAVGFVVSPKHRVNPALVSLALRFQPVQHVHIDPQGHRFFPGDTFISTWRRKASSKAGISE
jgi:hypothetical protein